MQKTSYPFLLRPKNLIYLQEYSYLQASKSLFCKRQNLYSYLFFQVNSGEGTLTYAGKTYHLQAGDCVFIDCRQSYGHNSSENLWKLSWVHFYGTAMDSIYTKYIKHRGKICFSPQSPAIYDSLLADLFKISISSDYLTDMLLFEKLVSLIASLMKETRYTKEDHNYLSKEQTLDKIKSHLENHYMDHISLNSLSEMFYISKSYLAHAFKQQFGSSINTYILNLRITHAKHLLRFTNHSIRTISIMCGIPDPNYFSKVFKKAEGMSPNLFRKMWMEDIVEK